jgi:hypothetical protein
MLLLLASQELVGKGLSSASSGGCRQNEHFAPQRIRKLRHYSDPYLLSHFFSMATENLAPFHRYSWRLETNQLLTFGETCNIVWLANLHLLVQSLDELISTAHGADTSQ